MLSESDPDPAERDQQRSRSIDAAIAELAARQHGVVAHRQLLGIGASGSAIGRRAARGALHRVHRGVYAVGHPAVSLQGRWMAAVLSAGEAAILSHQTAAFLHGLLPAAGPPIHVTARKRKPGEPGILVHGSSLPDDETTTRDRIPVTEPMRTLVDLAAVLSPHRLQRAADLARIGAPARRRRLEVLLARHRGRRGTAALRAILEAAERDAAIPRSELENRLRAIVASAGLPAPEVNTRERTTGRRYELDASWPAWRLAVELDGWESHGTRQAFEADRERDRRLAVAGWRVIRITWRQLRDEPALVAAHLRALLTALEGRNAF